MKYYDNITLYCASVLLFGSPTNLTQKLINNDGLAFTLDSSKITRGKDDRMYFIDRAYFMDFWKKLSDCEPLITGFQFRKILKVDKYTFNKLIDKNQRIKGLGVRASYFKLSYVKEVLRQNNIEFNFDNM